MDIYKCTNLASPSEESPNLLKIDRAEGQEIELGPAATGAGEAELAVGRTCQSCRACFEVLFSLNIWATTVSLSPPPPRRRIFLPPTSPTPAAIAFAPPHPTRTPAPITSYMCSIA